MDSERKSRWFILYFTIVVLVPKIECGGGAFYTSVYFIAVSAMVGLYARLFSQRQNQIAIIEHLY